MRSRRERSWGSTCRGNKSRDTNDLFSSASPNLHGPGKYRRASCSSYPLAIILWSLHIATTHVKASHSMSHCSVSHRMPSCITKVLQHSRHDSYRCRWSAIAEASPWKRCKSCVKLSTKSSCTNAMEPSTYRVSSSNTAFCGEKPSCIKGNDERPTEKQRLWRPLTYKPGKLFWVSIYIPLF